MKLLTSFFALVSLVLITSCSPEPKASTVAREAIQLQPANAEGIDFMLNGSNQAKEISTASLFELPENLDQIAQYVRNILEDKNGNLWFGTNGYGVCRYDGDTLTYFSRAEGLGGTQITGMVEDPEGNLWFSTNNGVAKYNGQFFVNYTVDNGLSSNSTWSIYCDRKGTIWAGTRKGLCRFTGKKFRPVLLPEPKLENTRSRFSTSCIWSITEDRYGNLWVGTDGAGAYKYSGLAFTNYTKQDGLTDNSIDCILEDQQGNLWMGTRFGGINKFDGTSFTAFSQSNGQISNDEVCAVYEDPNGDIWFSSEGYGVYRYNGDSLRNYSANEGLGVRAVQTVFQDRKGRLWAGGGGGLYRLVGDNFINVVKDGPWE